MVFVHFSPVCLLAITILICGASAYGEYIPKAVYLIDDDGSESQPIRIRSKRDIEEVLARIKRGGGAYSYSGSTSNGGFGGSQELAEIQSNVEKIINAASDIPNHVLAQVQNMHAYHPSGTNSYSGANSYSGSSSGSGGHSPSGTGYGNNHGGGSSEGYRTGSSSPNLFSRSGVEKGSGIKVSSAAQGPNAAFSFSSSEADGQGNVKYNVKSGQY